MNTRDVVTSSQITGLDSPGRRCTAAGARTFGCPGSAETSRTTAPYWGWAQTRRSNALVGSDAACPRPLCRWRRIWRSRSSARSLCSGRRSPGGYGCVALCSSWRPHGSRWPSSYRSEPSWRHAHSSGTPTTEEGKDISFTPSSVFVNNNSEVDDLTWVYLFKLYSESHQTLRDCSSLHLSSSTQEFIGSRKHLDHLHFPLCAEGEFWQ